MKIWILTYGLYTENDGVSIDTYIGRTKEEVQEKFNEELSECLQRLGIDELKEDIGTEEFQFMRYTDSDEINEINISIKEEIIDKYFEGFK